MDYFIASLNVDLNAIVYIVDSTATISASGHLQVGPSSKLVSQSVSDKQFVFNLFKKNLMDEELLYIRINCAGRYYVLVVDSHIVVPDLSIYLSRLSRRDRIGKLKHVDDYCRDKMILK